MTFQLSNDQQFSARSKRYKWPMLSSSDCDQYWGKIIGDDSLLLSILHLTKFTKINFSCSKQFSKLRKGNKVSLINLIFSFRVKIYNQNFYFLLENKM